MDLQQKYDKALLCSRLRSLVPKSSILSSVLSHRHTEMTLIINKILDAFSNAVITIYDTDLFTKLASLLSNESSSMLGPLFDSDNSWCHTVQSAFTNTITMLREYLATSNTTSMPFTEYVKLPRINKIIYDVLNCWVISIFTLVFIKQLFQLDTLPLDISYLLFITVSYSIIDFTIDESNESPAIITELLKYIEHRLTSVNHHQQPTISPDSAKMIDPLIKLLNATPYTRSRESAVLYSFDIEKQCFKLQKCPDINKAVLADLTRQKGISTGYLILSIFDNKVYNSCVTDKHGRIELFHKYCIILQLLDDLGDWEKDQLAGIHTSISLYDGGYIDASWSILMVLLDMLDDIILAKVFKTANIEQLFVQLFINYWCYSCCKHWDLLDTELRAIIQETYAFDKDYILELRAKKHAFIPNLYSVLFQDLVSNSG